MPTETNEQLSMTYLNQLSIQELNLLAKKYDLEKLTGLKKQEIIHKLLERQAREDGNQMREGVLEILPDGFGFLRSSYNCYLPSNSDVYVAPSQIKKLGLRTGDMLYGEMRPPKEQEKYYALVQIISVNGEEISALVQRPYFDDLTPYFPTE
ncbi:MAG TPA: Rho termination factor N-terminal domain-containing protein, partial [bacterium]|nr:Rho termination factor N-terminal domain-containing protein [bacterium]